MVDSVSHFLNSTLSSDVIEEIQQQEGKDSVKRMIEYMMNVSIILVSSLNSQCEIMDI